MKLEAVWVGCKTELSLLYMCTAYIMTASENQWVGREWIWKALCCKLMHTSILGPNLSAYVVQKSMKKNKQTIECS